MKILLYIIFFFLNFSLLSYGQYDKEIDINTKKDKILFLEKNTKSIIFYDILKNKVIKTYDLKYGFIYDSIFGRANNELNTIAVQVGFSLDNKMFYILNIFEDTNYIDKNWKPYRVYKFFNDALGDTGWYKRKTVTLSTLSFYSIQNGKFLFSLKDTGFYEPNTAIGSYSVRWNYDSNARMPCYFDEVNFSSNSKNIVLTSTFKHYKFQKFIEEGRYSSWDLTTHKKLCDTIKRIEFEKQRISRINYTSLSNSQTHKNFLYSNDSSIGLKYLSDSTAQFFETKTLKILKNINLEKDSTYQGDKFFKSIDKIYFSKGKNKLLLENIFDKLYAIYDINKNEIIRLKDIKVRE